MSLRIGTRVGPYEVTSQLGAGGMGQVYAARDARLNRSVAIKALQPAVAGDPDRIARFDREAQILASLQHPNIASIYGLEQAGGATYLVLEFVDGRPLDLMLKADGPLAAPHAIAIARQIADGIAAAHEKGIIHRDLKPGNVMVTADGHVKVLDFGLGKSLDEGTSAPGESPSADSPTIAIGATQAGIILGTAGYMSPEQAKGRAADRRSDVWAFGCVLFEMLAGSRAFAGEDVTDTIAAIVRGEPNWKALPASTPPALRTLIERCLVKDRAQRLPDMSVVRYALGESLEAGRAGVTSMADFTSRPAMTRAARPWMAVALVAMVAAVALGIAYLTRDGGATASAPVTARFTIVLPDGVDVANTNLAPLAIAPNGQIVAFSGRRAGRSQLYVHDVSTGETKALDGTDDARSPFFSPDGRWIGFFARGKLKKIAVTGTSLLDIAEAPDSRGGTWAADDVIYYAPTNTSGLWKVAASGGAAAGVTTLDPKASEISHRYPRAVAGGGLLFMAWTGPGLLEHRIEYLSLSDGARQTVVTNADGPIALVNGRIVYSGRQDTLLSAPWNSSRVSLQGVEPQALPMLVQIDNEGGGAYAVSDSGTVVHLMGRTDRRLARIAWIDRSGRIEALPLPDRDYVSAAISPDGTRAAIQHRGDRDEIWIFDFATKSFTPFLTPGGSSQAPVWTMDSKSLVYRGTRQGFRNLYRKAADGGGAEERLTNRAGVTQTPTSATPDGKWIIFTDNSGVWKMALDGAHETMPVVETPATDMAGQVSPDGQWLSYDSAVSGRNEVWVQAFAQGASGSTPTRQVSRDGGGPSRWSRDGRELYFMVGDGIMGVTVSGESFSQPRLLVQGGYRPPSNFNTNYDVARDGRFLHVVPIQPARPPTRIEVVLNGVPR